MPPLSQLEVEERRGGGALAAVAAAAAHAFFFLSRAEALERCGRLLGSSGTVEGMTNRGCLSLFDVMPARSLSLFSPAC